MEHVILVGQRINAYRVLFGRCEGQTDLKTVNKQNETLSNGYGPPTGNESSVSHPDCTSFSRRTLLHGASK